MPARPSVARTTDYWLGGCHHGQSDRALADHAAMVAPQIPYLVRAQRALLGRIVRYLLGQGVRQFLDLGSGIPTRGHVHEIAQDSQSPARVVYVDNDPGVAADGQQILAGHADAAYLAVDLLKPERVLDDPHTRRLLDFGAPIAVLAIATIQQIPDSDNPAGALATYLDAACSGSFLALSHNNPDERIGSSMETFDQMNLGPRPEMYPRDPAALAHFFTGLELVEPGIVPLPLWRPEPEDLGSMQNPERAPVHVGVGRKP
ncbi:MAG TPA: SAM-dependent methyltransferase [Actinophytocola sp.]|uniref:SAM-dependent methyltransferase n=1 Tax=Actinophytocola sp. TaxID=1872138 RepID=UPI002DBEBC34|nr:SAM-dependent methyltransferase [Actinophytocola sp.]HEU5473622.1 SAM-dependent methyltransferase [Actinophytocola sp.]